MARKIHFGTRDGRVPKGSRPFSAGLGGAPPKNTALTPAFFNRDAQVVACDLLGKVLAHRVQGQWLAARIVETEAYYQWEKASHASLGYTHTRRALFMPPGTLYLYYARGGDSFNISTAGEGNAVLVKAAIPWLEEGVWKDGSREGGLWEDSLPEAEDSKTLADRLEIMHALNPLPSGKRRPEHKLCAGQTLLCRALGLKVPHWDTRLLGEDPTLHLLDVGRRPTRILRTPRLGIPQGRDGHLPYRFVDADHAPSATRNPLTRNARQGVDYQILQTPVDAATLLAELPDASGALEDTLSEWNGKDDDEAYRDL